VKKKKRETPDSRKKALKASLCSYVPYFEGTFGHYRSLGGRGRKGVPDFGEKEKHGSVPTGTVSQKESRHSYKGKGKKVISGTLYKNHGGLPTKETPASSGLRAGRKEKRNRGKRGRPLPGAEKRGPPPAVRENSGIPVRWHS